MRILFMGSPKVAVPFLETVNKDEEVVGVVTQKDSPAGRGYKLTAPPVKEAALRLGLTVHQPEKIKNNTEFSELVKSLELDLIVVTAFGKILPLDILQSPKMGSVNIHFSLLPKYRGAAPVQWALINGEKQTGITIFWMNEKVDAGEIIVQEKIAISLEDTYITLLNKLISPGILVLKNALTLIKENKSPRIVQNDDDSTYAPLLRKQDGEIKWDKSSLAIYNLTRGLVQWPGAYTRYKTETGEHKTLKLLETKALDSTSSSCSGKPGEIVDIIKNEGFVVRCGEGYLLVKHVQSEGGKAMSCYDFLQGHKIKIGRVLGRE